MVQAPGTFHPVPLDELRSKNYEAEPCPKCGAHTVVRTENTLKCDACGKRSYIDSSDPRFDFEFKMGKLSDEDYQELRKDYEQEAYAVMREIEQIKPEVLQKTGEPQVVAVLKSEKKSKK